LKFQGPEWGVVKADEKYERGSTLSVVRGLHVFRYLEFKGGGVPAVARLIPPAEGVALLDMPGREEGLLLRPGDCVVVRAERASEIVVGLRRGSAEGSLDASFRLEAIALAEDTGGSRVTPLSDFRAEPTAEAVPLSFVAHVALRGDVAFEQGAWIGGPDGPASIEGLAIVDDPKSSALEMQVLTGSRPPRWSEWVGAGQYAGTRGHRLPLTGVRLRLKPEPSAMEISAEALFLGGLVASKRGRQVEFVSGSGVDPLVGLKISLRSAQGFGEVRAAPSLDASARDREPRVRVFRASAGR
jgi:hypothetical protein